MKKFILTLVLIVSCAFCFVGCDASNQDYWTPVSNSLTEFFASEAYQSPNSINFSDELDALIESAFGQDYAELTTTYIPLYNQSIFCSQKYAQVLAFTPSSKSANLKSAFGDISDDLEDYKAQILAFNTSKTNYESHLASTYSKSTENVVVLDSTKALSDFELTHLSKFKADFLSLIQTAYKLSQSVYGAYTKGYHNFVDYNTIDAENFTAEIIQDEQKLALNSTNLQLAGTQIKVLKLYVTKERTSDYNNFCNISKTFFEAMQSAYDTGLGTVDATQTLSKFKKWKGVYDLFIEDSQHFDQVIKDIKVDILKDCNNNAEEYAKEMEDPKAKSLALFYINYYNNAQILYDYTMSLV